jgi:hypothetical protein
MLLKTFILVLKYALKILKYAKKNKFKKMTKINYYLHNYYQFINLV